MNKQEIYLAGGCFWGMQWYFDRIPGVVNTEVGYLNGSKKLTSYKEVCNGSGHVEVVKVVYDLSILLETDIFDLFMKVIEPHSLNKQGEDIGPQYRVGIYSDNNSLLNKYKNLLTQWELSNDESVLEIMNINNYCKAEESHQNYLKKNPNGYCHINLENVD